jgi:hypothetical protein
VIRKAPLLRVDRTSFFHRPQNKENGAQAIEGRYAVNCGVAG